MFTLPEAEQLQVTERAKHKQRYIPHTLKKIISQVSHKRPKPPFLWSASMTEYVLLLQIWHFEMQIWTWKKKKLLWIKVDLVWKASLCVTAQPFRPCCTFQAYVLQRAATGLIALTGDTSLKRSHVSASRRNMQREEFLIKKKKREHFKIPKEKIPAAVCPAVEDLCCAEQLWGGSVWNWMRASPSSACE